MEIGVPDSLQANQYKNIGMKKSSAALKKESKGDYLNRLSGNNDQIATGVKFVDGKKHNKMGKDEFLKLLSHQLKNQDPLKPMDQNKFAADLAQFSQLEQLTNMNSSLKGMQTNAPLESKFYAASFLGKEVVTGGATVDLKDEGARAPVSFSLKDNARRVMVRVIDKNQQTVAQIEREGLSKGTHTLSWNGLRLDGQKAAKGVYHLSVMAWGEDLKSVPIETRSTGVVTGVNFENGEMMLKIDGKKKVALRDVESFYLPGQTPKMQKQAKQQEVRPLSNKIPKGIYE